MSKFVKLTGLWPTKSGRGWSGRLREAVTVPADARLMVLEVREGDRKDRGPTHELVYATDDEGAVPSRPDAPDRAVSAKESAAAVRMQAPSRQRPSNDGMDGFPDDPIPF